MRHYLARLVRSGVIYGLGGIFNRFISLLLLPLLTRYLTPEEYGISALLIMASFVASSVFSLGLDAGMGPAYFGVGKDEIQRGKVFQTSRLILVLSGAVMVLAGWLTAESLGRWLLSREHMASLVRLTFLATFMGIVSLPNSMRLMFEEKATKFVGLSAICNLATVGLNIWLVISLHRGLSGLIEARLLGQMVLLCVFGLAAPLGGAISFDRKIGIEVLRLSLPMMPLFAGQFLLLQFNTYILQHMGGLSLVGIYSVGFTLGQAMQLFVAAFQTSWFPFFMSFMDRQDEAPKLFGRIMTAYVLGFGLLTLLFFVTARPVALLFTQQQFHECWRIVGWSAMARFFLGIVYVISPPSYFAKEVWIHMPMMLAASVLAIIGNVICIWFAGLPGAGFGLALGVMWVPLLTHCWNQYRGNRYIPMAYETARLFRFAFGFAALALLFQIPRNWSVTGELALSAVSISLLAFVTWRLLADNEREIVLQSIDRYRSKALS
ncbi:MAG: lipopolysaccharide biosynthesis protein [Candidatus Riflebacteria bacterium]|nr:lipopolysaccharide biosynthesis protein [Candidatus Riflebacteria bacterium]